MHTWGGREDKGDLSVWQGLYRCKQPIKTSTNTLQHCHTNLSFTCYFYRVSLDEGCVTHTDCKGHIIKLRTSSCLTFCRTRAGMVTSLSMDPTECCTYRNMSMWQYSGEHAHSYTQLQRQAEAAGEHVLTH